jgi:hypothetical protein
MKWSGILFFIILSTSVTGQEIIQALPRWMAGIHFNIFIPGEPTDLFITASKPGLQFEFQYRVQYNKPFMAGVYYNEFTLSKYVLYYVQSSGTGDIDIKEKANTRRIETGITAGFYPEINWLLQPYLQGRAGFAIFQTSSILTDNNDHKELDRISEQSSSAPAYGLDLGIHIVPNLWYIRGDVRVGFVANTSASYMLYDKESTSTSDFPIDYFRNYSSAGRWFKFSAGISYLF